jgi:hypothetical protein
MNAIPGIRTKSFADGAIDSVIGVLNHLEHRANFLEPPFDPAMDIDLQSGKWFCVAHCQVCYSEEVIDGRGAQFFRRSR